MQAPLVAFKLSKGASFGGVLAKSSGKNHRVAPEQKSYRLTYMSEYFEIAVRWAFAMQMVFWGLNGFFQWIKIPPASPVIDQFVTACIETKFIMPAVKLIEIVFGSFLIINFAVPLSLVAFAPLLFVITGLHLFHNTKPWGVLFFYTLPYCLLVTLHSGSLLRLVH